MRSTQGLTASALLQSIRDTHDGALPAGAAAHEAMLATALQDSCTNKAVYCSKDVSFPCAMHRACIAHLEPPAALALLLAVGLVHPALLQLPPSQVAARKVVLAAQAALLPLLGPEEVQLVPAC